LRFFTRRHGISKMAFKDETCHSIPNQRKVRPKGAIVSRDLPHYLLHYLPRGQITNPND
jgi:hypothetical protein